MRAICGAAAEAGTTVTVDMEDHTTTDATLATVVALRADFPWVGAVLQSQLRRTEADCRDLAGPGSRVRLCKGAYDEPESVAFTDRADVDRSYVRCLKILFAGAGLPLVATHDPRLIAIAQHLGRDRPYELQMLYGVRPDAQVGAGRRRASGAGVRPLRHAVVRLLHAPAGRAPGERRVLPAGAGQPGLTRPPWPATAEPSGGQLLPYTRRGVTSTATRPSSRMTRS